MGATDKRGHAKRSAKDRTDRLLTCTAASGRASKITQITPSGTDTRYLRESKPSGNGSKRERSKRERSKRERPKWERSERERNKRQTAQAQARVRRERRRTAQGPRPAWC